jgi:hypothetical protein
MAGQWTRWWNFRELQRAGCSWLAEELVPCTECLGCVSFVRSFVRWQCRILLSALDPLQHIKISRKAVSSSLLQMSVWCHILSVGRSHDYSQPLDTVRSRKLNLLTVQQVRHFTHTASRRYKWLTVCLFSCSYITVIWAYLQTILAPNLRPSLTELLAGRAAAKYRVSLLRIHNYCSCHVIYHRIPQNCALRERIKVTHCIISKDMKAQ